MWFRDLIGDIKDAYRSPESIGEYHLFVFIMQALILFAVSLCIFSIAAENETWLKNEDGLVKSYISSFKNEETEKTLLELPSLNEDMENVVVTSRFIDFKNGGVWLSKRQEYAIASLVIALYLSPILYLFLGLGALHRTLRKAYFAAMGKTAALLIFPPLGVAVWGMISMFFWFIVCFAGLFLGAITLPLHLIMGIAQFSYIGKG